MNRLKTGEAPRPFETHDFTGEKIKLNDYKGKKIHLSFFRDASCPFCNLRLNQLIQNHDKFKNSNIEVITFFASTKDIILKFANGHKAPFPIIPDPDLKIYDLYSLETSFKAKLKTMGKPKKALKAITSEFFNLRSLTTIDIVPAEFMINGNFKVDKAFYGNDFGDHIPLDDILNWNA
ncbi:redoxin domain-containing protein [Flavobacteriaceae bacterium XHP0103]|uniref:peroxiredoxin family protein n=1 Tax=Marixanthotalea marina TaxID=2844359 RepID=UPI002989A5A1|nr:redoxin domain-containing protein [Marixanthotalea marina]MBU3821183.1 redoxin domain-containing protein [Marixanthotalea marina]